MVFGRDVLGRVQGGRQFPFGGAVLFNDHEGVSRSYPFNIVGKELAPLTRTGGSPQARAWSPRMTTTNIIQYNF